MRRKILKPRSTASIVQQMNTLSTADALRQIASGRMVDLPAGSAPRSYDFDDQTKVEFDAPRFGSFNNPQFDGFENLIDQSINASKIVEHLHPASPISSETSISAPSSAPIVDPATD